MARQMLQHPDNVDRPVPALGGVGGERDVPLGHCSLRALGQCSCNPATSQLVSGFLFSS